MPESMIEIENLRKEYGDLVAVGGISFEVRAGTIFGLLGPNGAGKSTTISCISSLIRPTSGEVRIAGHDIRRDSVAARRHLGLVPQELALYEDLSAAENLRYWGAAYGLRGRHLQQRLASVLEAVGLADRAKEPVKRYSGGMKRRLNFACGLVHEPRVLLLDEPTVGVDPQSRVRLLELVRQQAESGTAVLYTTHYMEEAQGLCDRLAIIDHGKIVAEGDLAQLQAMLGEKDLVRLSGRFDPAVVAARMERIDAAEIVQLENDSLVLALPRAGRALPEIFEAAAEAGAEIRETTISRPSLETLFIKLTGRELRE